VRQKLGKVQHTVSVVIHKFKDLFNRDIFIVAIALVVRDVVVAFQKIHARVSLSRHRAFALFFLFATWQQLRINTNCLMRRRWQEELHGGSSSHNLVSFQHSRIIYIQFCEQCNCFFFGQSQHFALRQQLGEVQHPIAVVAKGIKKLF